MNFVLDIQLLHLGIGLVGLILINILLGSMNAILERKFDKVKLINGAIKGVIISISFVGCVLIGQLNPDILVINANGQDINVLTAVNVILLSAYVWYGKECLTKLASFVNAKF